MLFIKFSTAEFNSLIALNNRIMGLSIFSFSCERKYIHNDRIFLPSVNFLSCLLNWFVVFKRFLFKNCYKKSCNLLIYKTVIFSSSTEKKNQDFNGRFFYWVLLDNTIPGNWQKQTRLNAKCDIERFCGTMYLTTKYSKT